MDDTSQAKNLFDRVPGQLFQPLAAPSRRTYAAALDRLFSLAQEAYVVEQEVAVLAVMDLLASLNEYERSQLREDTREELNLIEAAALVDESEQADSADAAYQSYRSQARAILRRLEDSGWLKEEQQSNYKVHFTFPEYTFPLLDGFRTVKERRPAEFEGMIYDLFRLVVDPKPAIPNYTLLQMAYQQAYQFVNRLKQLQHNIGGYVEAVVGKVGVHEILNHFSAYRADVSPTYHRLKTADNISRYRLDIQQTINRWIRSSEWIEKAVAEARARQPGLSDLDARHLIHEQMAFIERQFEQMKNLMDLIDERHVQYAEYAVSRPVQSGCRPRPKQPDGGIMSRARPT